MDQVAKRLRHPQPRGIDSGKGPGGQLLLLFRHPDGAAQQPGPELRIQANAGGPGATRI